MRIGSLSLISLLALCGARSMSGATEAFPWLDNLDAARAQALEQGRPVLAVFRCVP